MLILILRDPRAESWVRSKSRMVDTIHLMYGLEGNRVMNIEVL